MEEQHTEQPIVVVKWFATPFGIIVTGLKTLTETPRAVFDSLELQQSVERKLKPGVHNRCAS